MKSLFAEPFRRALIRLSISKLGGRNVTGGAHYVGGKFQEGVRELNTSLGIRGGLHAHQVESRFENTIAQALWNAEINPRVDNETGRRIADDFDWTKYDSSGVWWAMKELTPQQRRTAIKSNLLTFSNPPEPVDEGDDYGLL